MFNQRMGGFGGGGNMQNLMRQAQKMQEDMQNKLKQIDEELENTSFTTSAGGGMVEVTILGNKKITGIKINPNAIDPSDPEMLEDLIIAAANEAVTKATAFEKEKKDSVTGGLF